MAILGDSGQVNDDDNSILTNRAFALRATASENGRVVSMTIEIGWSVSLLQSMFFKPIIWDSGKNVLYNGGATEFVTPISTGANYAITLNFNKAYAIVKDTTYWIGSVVSESFVSGDVGSWPLDATNIGETTIDVTNSYASPNSLSATTDNTSTANLYVTYIPSPAISQWNGVSFSTIDEINNTTISGVDKIYGVE